MLDEIIDLVYPVSCIACGRAGGRGLCGHCLAGLASRCALWVTQSGDDCGGPATCFSGYRAAGEYSGLIREMVLKLKSSAGYYAPPLARLMVASAGNDPGYISCDYVCYVPSTREKIAQRGYNPAKVLARRVARHLGRPIFDGLAKTRMTLEQDRLAGASRWENVAGAFGVTGERVPLGSVVLVDDVMTTGATADACARALLDSGADAVQVLVAARTVLNWCPAP
ncbi:MAG: ComF family protein [Actinobacteria bacterium]|nr:ComF family protein [Actinomycetota bacterium]MCG2819816.1 ComF family protein [Actinomycetes bacterium]MBU4179396.1 ComF family protein [Actinomycetota bacterium]MBU4217774.1 ComF family protein [Actinomycetota bacterium]MBU4358005.1 ComF family protein [Actinomycetota bacterium]